MKLHSHIWHLLFGSIPSLRNAWLPVIFLTVACSAAETNLVSSPPVAGGKASTGWTFSGGKIDGAGIIAAPTQIATLRTTITAAKGTELVITANVKSNGKVIAAAGEVRMAYHRQGQAQQLAGFVRIPDAGKLDLVFSISSLDRKTPAQAQILDVKVQPFTRPDQLKRLPATGETPIVSAGIAQAVIIYPSSNARFRALAEQVAECINKHTGASIPLMSDTDATLPDQPVLKKELRDRHLILIGRLGINRAMWAAYGRWLDATDGYHPGGDGFVVRTAANVLRNGRNHLILGGSSDAGVGRAVSEFIKILDAAKSSRGELVLPFTLKIELGGECLKAFEQADAAWKVNAPTLPPVEPGYGSVRRWYENAMGWYFSGWESYRARADETLAVVLNDKAYTHHYIAEFLVRTYDMVDETGLLTETQRRQMESIILSNFLDFATVAGDSGWMTTFTPPYESINITNRHQISPWLADLTLAGFVSNTFELPTELKLLAEFRESEKGLFIDHVLKTRWEASFPGGLDETQEEFAMGMARFALERDQFVYLNSGNAAKSIALEKIAHSSGMWVRPGGAVDSQWIFNLLATYHKDGRYLTLAKKIPTGVQFMNRTVNGVHRFQPGPELAPADPIDLAGMQMPAMMPQRAATLDQLKQRQFAPVKLNATQVFDFVSFRTGFEKDDDYVAVNGLAGQGMPGVFLSFLSHGVQWFPGGVAERISGGAGSYFGHNAPYVLRVDQWQDTSEPYVAAARLDWKANFGMSGAFAFSMDPHAGSRWQRAVVRVDRGLYVVRDTITAREAGDYQVMLHWRPAGAPQWDGTSWLSRSGDAEMRLTPITSDFGIAVTIDDWKNGLTQDLALRLSSTRSLKKDESLRAYAAISVAKSPEAAAGAMQIEHGVLLNVAGKNSGAVVFGPSAPLNLHTDGQCVVLTGNSLHCVEAKSLKIGDAQIVQSSVPVSFMLDTETGEFIVDHSALKSVSLMGTAVALSNQRGRLAETGLQQVKKAVATALASAKGAAATSVAAADTGAGSQIVDVSGTWKRAWEDTSLNQPMPAKFLRSLPNDVIDLGRNVLIAEIYPRRAGGPWRVDRIPEDLRYAVDDGTTRPPEPDSPAWKSFPPPKMLPGVVSGNYGKAEPTAEDHEIIQPDNLRARYLRSKQLSSLIICDAESRGRQVPLTMDLADLDGDGAAEIFIRTLAWPKFLRDVHRVTDTVASFFLDGRQRYRHDYDLRVQTAELVRLKTGTSTPLVATQDGKIRLLAPDGAIQREFDLFALHQQFHREFGRGNTRQPAGGFTLPFAVAPWRPAGSEPGFVVARYHSFSFLGADGSLEGVRMEGSYVQPALLPEGIDMDGDGAQEQVCLGRGALFRVRGPMDRHVAEPSGAKFFPQVYKVDRLPEPAQDDRLDGTRPLIFQTIVLGASESQPRYVLSARQNYVAIYDALKHEWIFSWVPLVPLRAAALIEDSGNHVRVAAVTSDGLLWQIEAGVDPKSARVSVVALPFEVQSIAPAKTGDDLYLAGPRGIFRKTATALEQICTIDTVDIKTLSAQGVPSLFAIGRDASLSRWDQTLEGNE